MDGCLGAGAGCRRHHCRRGGSTGHEVASPDLEVTGILHVVLLRSPGQQLCPGRRLTRCAAILLLGGAIAGLAFRRGLGRQPSCDAPCSEAEPASSPEAQMVKLGYKLMTE